MNELRLFYLLIFLYNTILNNMGGSGCTGKLFFLYFFFFHFVYYHYYLLLLCYFMFILFLDLQLLYYMELFVNLYL